MNIAKKMSLKTKLLGLCIFMSSVSVALGVLSFRGLQEVEESYDMVADYALPNLNALNDMYLSYRSLRINLRTLGLPGLTREQANEAIQKVHESIEEYEKADKTYNAVPFRVGEQKIYDKVNASWKGFKALSSQGLELYASGIPENQAKLMSVFLHDCPAAAKEFTAAVNELKAFHVAAAKGDTLNAKSHAQHANQLTLIFTLAGVSSGLVIGYLLATNISRTIARVAQELNSNAVEVSSASAQIASASQELSQATTEQAASLEQTASSLEEISAMISKAAGSAKATAQSSLASQRKAEAGCASMEQVLSSMDEINKSNEAIMSQVTDGNHKMIEIVKVIEEIGSKTKVINDIVFQTKLLSFNASVEAARAGEHGKGFSVVAEEIGSLAQMSGNAAKEISSLLDGSISKVNTIASETRLRVEALVSEGKTKVEVGVQVARQCANALNEIVQDVSRVSGLAQEISDASQEQAQGVSEINKAMNQLDSVTQNNSVAGERTANAAVELSAQAESMKVAVVELAKVVNGDKGEMNDDQVAEPREWNENVISKSWDRPTHKRAA